MFSFDKKIPLFTIRGTTIGIYRSFFLIVLLTWYWGGPWPERCLFSFLLLGSILVHEIAHALAGALVGNRPQAITLSFFGGVTEFQTPILPNGRSIFIAFAGPLSNILLVLCMAVGAKVLCGNGDVYSWLRYFVYDFFDWEMTKVSLPVGVNVWHCGSAFVGIPCEAWDSLRLVKLVAFLNGILGVFNLFPAFPLDGGRIFRGLAGYVLGGKRAASVTMVVGRILAVALACWCVGHDLILEHEILDFAVGCFIAWAVWFGSYGEYLRTKLFVDAEAGDPEAEYDVGCLYQEGILGAKDMGTAVKWFEKSAEHGSASAQFEIAQAYEYGDGVEPDKDLAFTYATKAAEQKDPSALALLGAFYEDGFGCDPDDERAFALYREAAELGSARGQYEVACRYVFGSKEVERDVGKAKKLLEEAWAQEYVPAAIELHLMYEFGLLVIDDGNVLHEYRKAIENAGPNAADWLERRRIRYNCHLSIESPDAPSAETEEAE